MILNFERILQVVRSLWLTLTAVAAIVGAVLVLYLYPLAGIDPLDAYPFYTHSAYRGVCVPYAIAFLVLAFLATVKRRQWAAKGLVALFLVSHVHLKILFPDIQWKPLFVAAFVAAPAAAMIMGVLVLRRRPSSP